MEGGNEKIKPESIKRTQCHNNDENMKKQMIDHMSK